MIKINDGIVFSNDIKQILKGNNSLNYSYQDNGMFISNNMIELVRSNFENTVSKIFDKVTIIKEDEMEDSMLNSIKDVVGVYPHYIFG